MAMRILITNDDGYKASQLVPFIKWCARLGEVTVVVPKQEQSGKSHGIEIHKPFEAKQIELEPGINAWVVDSTPADCVRFAILGLHKKFDIVISGINNGFNIGADTLYSGTVSAASEANLLGVQAAAISTCPENYENAINSLPDVLNFVLAKGLLGKCKLYNINIPANPKGILITRQGGPYYSDTFNMVGNDMYLACGYPVWQDRQDNSYDTDATLHGYISITPMTVDKTDTKVFEEIKTS